MRSPSTTLSPWNKGRCGHVTYPQYIVPAGFVLAGLKNNNNNNSNNNLYQSPTILISVPAPWNGLQQVLPCRERQWTQQRWQSSSVFIIIRYVQRCTLIQVETRVTAAKVSCDRCSKHRQNSVSALTSFTYKPVSPLQLFGWWHGQGSFLVGTPGNGIPRVILTVGTAF